MYQNRRLSINSWSEAFGGLCYVVALVTISRLFDDHQTKIMMITKDMNIIMIGIAYSVKL